VRTVRRRVKAGHVDDIIDFDPEAFKFLDVFGHGERIVRQPERIKEQ
jgi:hypothetical protein